MSQKKKNLTNPENAQVVDEMESKKLLSQEDYSTDAKSAILSQEKSLEATEADENRDKEQALDIQESASITDDELKKELKRFLIPKIRSASYRWGERSKAIKAARVERGRYRCAMCGNKELKNGEFVLDHKEAVVSLDGWDGNWDTYINRMFVKAEGFQTLCHPCHEIKTSMEVQLRKIRREARKKLAKE